MVSLLLHAVIRGLHDLAAVVWIGAILVNALVLIPAFKGSTMMDEQLRRRFMQVQRRLSLLVPPSIVVVVVTGILEARLSPAFHGILLLRQHLLHDPPSEGDSNGLDDYRHGCAAGDHEAHTEWLSS